MARICLAMTSLKQLILGAQKIRIFRYTVVANYLWMKINYYWHYILLGDGMYSSLWDGSGCAKC